MLVSIILPNFLKTSTKNRKFKENFHKLDDYSQFVQISLAKKERTNAL
ncbi:hypothetical protein STRDD11_01733 [Streptococcus sp. DD11]|nr:hypothetical protein STRDD11_01733 [Streptococcus sp. DD11]